MKKTTLILDRLSGYLFLTGFITSKLKNIPVVVISALMNLMSLFAYIIGYVAWYLSAFLNPSYPRKKESWYGFAEFKEQYKIAALLGIIATIITLIGLTAPALLVPTAWIYAISNLIWTVSEHHKKNNPSPEEIEFSSTKQHSYFKYTLLVTASSLVAATAATIVLFFPASAFIIVTTATIIGTTLTIASLYYWGKCAFGKHAPDRNSHSYETISDQLTSSLEKTEPTSTPMKTPVYQRMSDLSILPSAEKKPPPLSTSIVNVQPEESDSDTPSSSLMVKY